MKTSLLLFACALLTCSAFAETRSWTNTSGVTIEAEFISQTEDTVRIRRMADQQEFEIPIATLSEADQAWLKSQQSYEASAGIYIAAGHGGHRMSSNDGMTWTNHEFWGEPAHNQQDLKAIATGNGVCVVVGGFSKSNILVTNDGVNWEQNPFNMGVLSGVIFVNDHFYAFGEGGKVAESEKGAEWAVVGQPDIQGYREQEMKRLGLDALKTNIRTWRHANGVFVGAGDSGVIVSTRDFQDWTFAERKEPLSRLNVETDGAGFVVRGETTLHYSADGVDWVDVAPEFPEGVKLNSLVHDGERFILNSRGTSSPAWESADGKMWTQVEGATFPNSIAAVRPDLYYSFQTYWKFTEDLLMSTDGGTTWTSAKLPAPTGVTCVVHAQGIPQF